MLTLEDEAVPHLSVVMPVYNERATIEEILRRVQAVGIEKEILVVDDGSTDGTRELLAALSAQSRGGLPDPKFGLWTEAGNAKIFFEIENRGKGAAVRRGFAEARWRIVLVQDADLELDPEDYFKLLPPIEEGRADAVYGTRFFNGRPAGMLLRLYLGNRLLTCLSNLLTGLRLSDVWTGYKALRRDLLAALDLGEDGFSIEAELTAKLARAGCSIYEVAVSYHPRSYAEQKKFRLRDGLAGIWATVRHSLF